MYYVDENGNRIWNKPRKTKRPKRAGIYAIEIPRLKRAYIGLSVNMDSRWSQHRRVLNQGKCENEDLQLNWDRHKDEFEFKQIYEAKDGDTLSIIEKEMAQGYVDKGWTLMNNYFHIDTSSVIIRNEHKNLIIQILRLLDKGRLDPVQMGAYLDSL
jgi:hypothetical protein